MTFLRFEGAVTNSPCYSIISAVTSWIESPFMPIDPDILSEIREFANSVTSSPFMAEKAKKIVDVIDNVSFGCTCSRMIFTGMQTEENPLPWPSELLTSVTALLDNTFEQMATALTALDRVRYNCLRPADYINYVLECQGPNRVADACTLTLKITLWVKQRVLRSENIKTRGKAFKFFLETAEVGVLTP